MSTPLIPRNIPNPLQRDGTSQPNRLLESLKPDSLNIDDKNIDDWLNYAHQYAELLQFYNLDNVIQGDWTDFFEQDISTLIAFMGEKKPLDIRKGFLAKLENLKAGDKSENERLITEILTFLQNYANSIQQWFLKSSHTFKDVPELLIHGELKRLIPSIIGEGFNRIIAYLKRGEQLELSFKDVPNGMFHIHVLEEEWLLTPILGKFTPLEAGIPETEEEIKTEINLLKPLFNRFYEVHQNIYHQTEILLNNSLESFPAHQPHLALFIACLQVFKTNQEHLNTLTKSHLDFYYEDVLKLKHAPEIADKVHLVFELAQTFFEQKIEEDRRFLAGTDDIGEDLAYASDAEIVVNTAQLDEEIGLKNIHIHKNREGEIVNIFGAPDADSEDGLGEELLSDDGKWDTFGTNNLEKTPHAEIGFAIASPMFLLAEGEREIHVNLRFDHLAPIVNRYSTSQLKSELRNNVDIFLTTENGWEKVDQKSVDILLDLPNPQNLTLSDELGEIIYSFTLPINFPAIVPYSEEIHESGFSTIFPVLRFILDNDGLSSLGDVDLTLGSGVNLFDHDRLYLTDEITLVEDANDFKVFKVNGDIRGVYPGEDPINLWQLVDISNVTPYNNIPANTPIDEGDIYSYSIGNETPIFYANADFNKNDGYTPIPSIELWEVEVLSAGIFDPTSSYVFGDLVTENNIIYQAQQAISPIAPHLNPTFWQVIVNVGSLTTFTPKGLLVEDSSSIFKLNAETTTISPSNNSQIWEVISVKDANHPLGFFEGDYAKNGNILYKMNLPGETSALPGSDIIPDLWEEIDDYGFSAGNSFPDDHYVKVPNTSSPGNNDLYQANLPISMESVTGHINIIDPEENKKIWEPVFQYVVPGSEYPIGTFVFELTGTIYTFYFKKDLLGSGIPLLTDTNVWENIGTIDTSIQNLVIDWQPSTNYFFQEIVRVLGIFYGANLDNFDFSPNSSSQIWTLNNVQVQYDNNPTLPYDQGDIVFSNFNNLDRLFIAQSESKGISPEETNNLWELILPSINAVTFNQNQFPLNSAFLENDIVEFTPTNGSPQFYIARAANKGFYPNSGKDIWEDITGNLTGYDPVVQYIQDDIVSIIWNSNFYVAISTLTTDELAPSVSPNTKWINTNSLVADYDARTVYQKGSFATVGSTLYKANAKCKGKHPLDNFPIWSEIDEVEYDNNTKFERGTFAKLEDGSVYRANAGIKGVSPDIGDNILLWEVGQTISIYSSSLPPSTQYLLGSYMEFIDGFYYRPLVNITGLNSTPATTPELWLKVGDILDFSPDRIFLQDSHARAKDGTVYRAKVFVDKKENFDGIFSPDEWEEVEKSYPYKYLHSLDLERIDLFSEVTGMKNLILENDQGVINPDKPFTPFGSLPIKESNFYIGHNELFRKSLTEIILDFEYGDLPEVNFDEHYRLYDEAIYTVDQNGNPIVDLNIANTPNSNYPNEHFTATFKVLYQGEIQEGSGTNSPILPTGSIELFETDISSGTLPPKKERTGLSVEFNSVFYKRSPRLETFTSFSQNLQTGFILMSLDEDFLHEEYPNFLSKAAISQFPELIPNTPYTPLINSIKLGYTAKETIILNNKVRGDFENFVEQFFHIHPFGQTEFLPIKDDDQPNPIASPHLVPTFKTPLFDDNGNPEEDNNGNPIVTDSAGTLFIGIKDAKPLETVNILFQVAESSENPDTKREKVIWSYLAHNRWVDFAAGDVTNDTTNGLLTSGIIQFAMPRKVVVENTILPAGLFWIKASVAQNEDSVAKLIVVKTQAVQASYRNSGLNDPEHPRNPLEAETIAQLEERLAAINTVSQPFASFGGKVGEQEIEFYTRVSERLRHKDRGINIFDIERLVLQEFPEIYKVKAVNHSTTCNAIIVEEENCVIYSREHAPGKVKVAVLPNLRNQNAIDPLRPRASKNTLFEIEKFLKKRMSDFVELEVDNPLFEEVKVNCRVVFKEGKDKAFYKKQLNQDLIRFLSPWLFDDVSDLPFGGSFHRALVLEYLDKLDYVDYITHLTLDHIVTIVKNDSTTEIKCQTDLEEIRPTTACSVLVSVKEHDITVVLEDELPCIDDEDLEESNCIKFP